MTSKPKKRSNPILNILRTFTKRIDLYSLAIGIAIGLLGFTFLTYITNDASGFFENLVPEAVGLIFTVLILDNLGNMREERSMTEQLVRRMHSRYNQTARAAIEELRVIGKLSDGTLHGRELRGSDWVDANLYEADLTNCDLTNAKLFKADFVKANLTDVKVTEEQLASTETMAQATMPDGSLYDGRYNLIGDFSWAKRTGKDVNSPEDMASFYGVSLKVYLAGQQWWRENRHRFKERSGHYDENAPSNQML
jgi:hypothetical protein